MSRPNKINKLLLTVFIIHMVLTSYTTTSTTLAARSINSRTESLIARLKLDQEEGSGPNNSCWDSMFELKSCSSEVVLFFLNGNTHLGPNCCKAIVYIESQCWPSMMSSLGFTSEESNVLRGFCDHDLSSGSGSGSGSDPATPPPTELHECYHLPRLSP